MSNRARSNANAADAAPAIEQRTVCQAVAVHIAKRFSYLDEAILFAGEDSPIWAAELEAKLIDLANAADDVADHDVQTDQQIDAAVAAEARSREAYDEGQEAKLKHKLPQQIKDVQATELQAEIRERLQAENEAKRRIKSQQYFLQSAMDSLLQPYYDQLASVIQAEKDKPRSDLVREADIAFKLKVIREIEESYQDRFSEHKWDETELSELREQLDSEIQTKLNKSSAERDEYITDHIRKNSPAVKAINKKIAQIKKTINRSVLAYNKTQAGQDDPCLSVVVAIPARVGGAFQSKNEYRAHLERLSTKQREEEWNKVTQDRLGFKLRLAFEVERLAEQEQEKYGSIRSMETIKRQAQMKLLLGLYVENANKDCDKIYQVINYEEYLLNKAKSKVKKHANFWIRVVGSVLVGFTEGLVAADAIFGVVSKIPGIGVAAQIIKVLVFIASWLVNNVTLFTDGKGPIKSLMNGTLLGEKGEELSPSDRAVAIVLMASTFAYGFIIGGLFSFMALSSISFPIVPALVLSALSVVTITALFLNVAMKFVKNGGVKKLKENFNLTALWRRFSIENPEMPVWRRAVTFVLFKVLMERVLGTLLVAAAFYGFSMATVGDGKSLGNMLGGNVGVQYAIGIIAVVLSSVIFNVFTYQKLKVVWNQLKSVIFGENGIFYKDEDGKLKINGGNFLDLMKKAATSFGKALVRTVVLAVSLALIGAAAVLSTLFLGLTVGLHKKIKYKTNEVYREEVDTERKENHEIYAKSNAALTSTTKMLALFMLGKMLYANSGGQAMLNGQGVMHAIPGAAGDALNGPLTVAAAGMAGISSQALNQGGLEEAVGRPNFGSDIMTLLKHVAFTFVYMFTQHTNKARKGPGEAPTRHHGQLSGVFKCSHEELLDSVGIGGTDTPPEEPGMPAVVGVN
jgi:hypothetical protein